MRLIITAMLALVSCYSLAQPVSAERRAEILEMLEYTGAMRLGDQVGNLLSQQVISRINAQQPGMPPRVPEIVRAVTDEHMKKFMSDPATIDALVELYASHFTQADVKAIVAFYKTPAGDKLRTQMPPVTAEALQFAQSKMGALLPALQQDLVKRLQAEGFAAQPGAVPAQ